MKRSEMVKLFSVLAVAYPSFDRCSTAEPTLSLWYEMLEDIEFDAAVIAAKSWIARQPFPPSIADLRRESTQMLHSGQNMPDAAAAWGEVMQAIKRYGLYQSERAFQSMSPLTVKVVRCMGWRSMNVADENSLGVLRGQFMKLYQQAATREHEQSLLPESLKASMKLITGKER